MSGCFQTSKSLFWSFKVNIFLWIWFTSFAIIVSDYTTYSRMQGRSDGGERGCNSPGAESLWERQIAVRGAEWFLGRAKKSQQCHRQAYFLQYNSFASERPQFRTWGTKLASCPGRHLTSWRPCKNAKNAGAIMGTKDRTRDCNQNTSYIAVYLLC